MMFGATVISVQGSYEDTFRLSAEAIDRWGWYNRNAAINPYLMEGRRQWLWKLPSSWTFKMTDYGDFRVTAVRFPEYGRVLRIFMRLRPPPRLISVQAEAAARSIQQLKKIRPKWRPQENTLADSIAVGVPRNPVKALKGHS